MKKNKLRIFYLILGHKTRSILNTTKIYDIAVEIATIKHYLNNLDKDPDNSEKTQKLKEDFEKKLPKLGSTFHEEFYKLYNTGRWIQFPQLEKGRIWDKYMYILKKVN